jgi:hypothetical protein
LREAPPPRTPTRPQTWPRRAAWNQVRAVITIKGILAGFAIERIITVVTIQIIVPIAAMKLIITAETIQCIVAGKTVDRILIAVFAVDGFSECRAGGHQLGGA